MKDFFVYYWNHDPRFLWVMGSLFLLLSLTLRFIYVNSRKCSPRRNAGWQERLRRELGVTPQTWNNLTYEDRKAIRDAWAKCNSKGVELDLCEEASVPYPGGMSRVSGYFVGDELGTKPRLCVATGKPTSEWMLILLHESSHMDQWSEGCDVWKDGFIGGEDVYDILQEWLDGKRELDGPQQDDVISRCVAIELDCEKRTARKMASCGMMWYIHDYIRKANAYIWSYHMVKLRRRWYSVPPYEVFEVWGPMPDRFMEKGDYLKMSWETSMAFDVKCFGYRKADENGNFTVQENQATRNNN